MSEKNGPDALELLKKDHDTVEDLLDELTGTSERATKKRTELLSKIAVELRVHARIEEEIFYPALKDAAQDKEQRAMLAEALEEHRAVEELVLPDLENTDVGSVQFRGRAKVLKELVTHHKDEEEKEMFKHAQTLLSKDARRDLGARMRERKSELLDEMKAVS